MQPGWELINLLPSEVEPIRSLSLEVEQERIRGYKSEHTMYIPLIIIHHTHTHTVAEPEMVLKKSSLRYEYEVLFSCFFPDETNVS